MQQLQLIFCFHSALHKFRQYDLTSLQIATAGLGQYKFNISLAL